MAKSQATFEVAVTLSNWPATSCVRLTVRLNRGVADEGPLTRVMPRIATAAIQESTTRRVAKVTPRGSVWPRQTVLTPRYFRYVLTNSVQNGSIQSHGRAAATFLARLEFYGGAWAALGEEIENRSGNCGKLLP